MTFRKPFQGRRNRRTRNRQSLSRHSALWSLPRLERLEERLPLAVSIGVSGTALTIFVDNSSITEPGGARETVKLFTGTDSSLLARFGDGTATQVSGATALTIVISGTNPVNPGLGVLVDSNPDNPPAGFGPLNFPITITGGNENDTFNVSPLQAVTATGGGGNDSLTVDFANVGASSATISFDGGAAGDDSMAISGGVDAVYKPSATTNGSGAITASGRTISFSNLEPVDFDLAGAGSFTLQLPNANDVVNVANGTTSIGGLDALVITGTSGGVAFESAHVRNATTLTIDTVTGGSNGTDQVFVNSANNAHGNTNLAISTGDSNDFIAVRETTVTGDVSIEAGTGGATVQGRNLRLGGDLKFTMGDGFKFIDIAGADIDGDIIGNFGDSGMRFDLDNGTTINPSDISGDINLEGGAGNDRFDIDRTNIGGNVDFKAGEGNNRIYFEYDTKITGNLTMTAGAGNDDVTLDDFVTFADGDFQLGDGSNRMDFNETVKGGGLSITGGSGTDNLDLSDTELTGDLTLDLGEGTNNLYVERQGGSGGATIGGNLNVTAGSGSDLIRFNTSGDGLTISGDATINVGDGANTFDLDQAFKVSGNLSITSGTSDDLLLLRATEVGGDLTIDLDAATTKDEANLVGLQVGGNVSITTSNGADKATVNNTDVVGDLTIELGGGNNTVELETDVTAGDTTVGANLKITTGSGNDTIRFHTSGNGLTIGGNATIDAGEGVNTWDLDQAFAVTGNLSITSGDSDDLLELRDLEVGGDLAVDLGAAIGIDRGSFDGIDIGGSVNVTGTGGKQRIDIDSGTIINPTSITGDVTMDSGDGDDELYLDRTQIGGSVDFQAGEGNNTLYIEYDTKISGNLSMTAGAGNDEVTLDDNAEVTGDMTLELGSGANRVDFNETVTVGGNLAVTTGAGNDTIQISDTQVSGDVTLQLGDGTNETRLEVSGGDGGTTVGDDLTITTGSGTDTIRLNSSGDGLSITGDVKLELGLGSNAVNATAVSVGGNLEITSIDDLSLTGSGITLSSGNAQVSVTGAGKLLTSSLPLTASLGSVGLTADDMALSGVVSAATTASLHVANSPRPIDMGTNQAGTLGLTDAELDLVSAPVLNVGNATAGASNVSANITRAAATAFNVGSSVSTTVPAGITLDTNGGSVSPVSSLLVVNGTVQGNVMVPAGSTLNGSGIINGSVSGAGSFSPGNSPGVMTINGNFSPTGTTSFEVNSPGTTPGTHFDQFVVNGGVTISGSLLSLTGTLVSPALGQEIVLIKNDGIDPVSGTFTGLPNGATVTFNSLGARILYNGGDGNDVVLTILNPTAAISGPATVAVGYPFNFTFSSDQVDINPNANVTYAIDWNGDSTVDETIVGLQSGITVPHAFPTLGTHNVGVRVTSSNGIFSATASKTVNAVNLLQFGNDLYIVGTPQADVIAVQPTNVPGQVLVSLNGVTSGPFTPTGTIYVDLLDGNDLFQMQQVNIPGNINGRGGNDTLIGGGGSDIIRGGAGNDLIRDVNGNDILLGGAGDDRLVDTAGYNLLIGGEGMDLLQGWASKLIGTSTAYEDNDLALLAVLNEWRTSPSALPRMYALNEFFS